MTEPIKTGVDILRQTLRARNRSPHALSMIASEIPNVGGAALEAFAHGKANLNDETLCALAKVLYPHSEFDPELKMLSSCKP